MKTSVIRPEIISPKVFKEIPSWVKRYSVGETSEYVYAGGCSPPAFYYKDTVENTKNQARTELAKTIKVQVKEEINVALIDKIT
ncbi:MAG: hypothetical protein ABIJ11_04995 [Elusimicrobiota bacterium]